ncbi:hypothetical protein RHCRD62_40195 [Rhodococcus sp. RD6.2]|nr:hypothetical protein RHCRD62_40195 [Rhodococcus sp. RD6.2]
MRFECSGCRPPVEREGKSADRYDATRVVNGAYLGC